MPSGTRHSTTSEADRHSDVHGCAWHIGTLMTGAHSQSPRVKIWNSSQCARQRDAEALISCILAQPYTHQEVDT